MIEINVRKPRTHDDEDLATTMTGDEKDPHIFLLFFIPPCTFASSPASPLIPLYTLVSSTAFLPQHRLAFGAIPPSPALTPPRSLPPFLTPVIPKQPPPTQPCFPRHRQPPPFLTSIMASHLCRLRQKGSADHGKESLCFLPHWIVCFSCRRLVCLYCRRVVCISSSSYYFVSSSFYIHPFSHLSSAFSSTYSFLPAHLFPPQPSFLPFFHSTDPP